MADILRIEFPDLAPEVQDLLRPRVERLGYLGEFFKVTAHQPAALGHFYRLTEDLKEALAPDITETVALTAATRLGSDYERNQHERLSLKLGFAREWVAQIERCDPDAAAISDTQRSVQRFTLKVLENFGKGAAAQRDALVAAIGDAAAVGVMFLVGRYATHAMIVNALELAPPVQSIFERELA